MKKLELSSNAEWNAFYFYILTSSFCLHLDVLSRQTIPVPLVTRPATSGQIPEVVTPV